MGGNRGMGWSVEVCWLGNEWLIEGCRGWVGVQRVWVRNPSDVWDVWDVSVGCVGRVGDCDDIIASKPFNFCSISGGRSIS